MSFISHRLPHARTVAIIAVVAAGEIFESRDSLGVAHLLEHLHMECAEHPRHPEIGRKSFDTFRGYINAVTNINVVRYQMLTDAENVPAAIKLMSAILMPREYDETTLANEKKILANELAVASGPRSGYVAVFDKKHPLAIDIQTVVRKLVRLPRNVVCDLDKQWYAPARMSLAIVGNVTESHREMVHAEFAGWSADQSELSFDFPNALEKLPRRRVFPIGTQAKVRELQVGFITSLEDDLGSMDHWAVGAFFNGLQSPLAGQLRYGDSKTYHFGFGFDRVGSQRLAIFNASTTNRHVAQVFREICESVGKLKRGEFDVQHLQTMKNQLRFQLYSMLESPFALADFYSSVESVEGLPDNFSIEACLRHVDRFEACDLANAAKKLFPKESTYLWYNMQWRHLAKRTINEALAMVGD